MDRNTSLDKYLFEGILGGTEEGIAVVNSQGIIEKCNEKLQKILNLSKEDIEKSPIEKIMPNLKIDKKEFANYEIQTLKKQVSVRKKVIMECKDHLEILFVSENQFNYEIVKKYEEVKIQKDMFESILNSIDEGIHVADKSGKLRFINPAQELIDGYNAKDILGKRWLDVYDLDDDTSLILKVLKEGKPILNVHQNYVANNKKYVNVVCSCIPLKFNDESIGAVAITKDYIKFKEIAEKVLDIEEESIARKNNKIKHVKKQKYYSFDEILGHNTQILESIQWAKAAAKSKSSVLIYGETGTGKEMYAQSIHMSSNRSKERFLAINCAAIPENLLEGILFGTTKGIYTGAMDRKGLLEQACGGTLFLDEINSMPVFLQSKLLRVIEEKKIMRLGDNKEIDIDVRFISSCNIDPAKEIEDGRLRADLFYRLAAIYLTIPPLRNRIDDLKLLCEHFIQYNNYEMNKNIKGLSPQVFQNFCNYHWPGNIRQLKHCIESSMNLTKDDDTIITERYMPKYLMLVISTDKENKTDNASKEINILQEIENEEKKKIIDALKKNAGNVAKAATELGMSRQKLHYRLAKYNLK